MGKSRDKPAREKKKKKREKENKYPVSAQEQINGKMQSTYKVKLT